MSRSWAAERRLFAAFAAIALAVATLAIIMVSNSGRAGAADYPPPGPSSVTTCVPSSSNNCGVGPTSATSSPGSPSSEHHSNLASTGFDTAIALLIVALLVGVGGLCLAAGLRRRRHT